jgi:hypothetical protein
MYGIQYKINVTCGVVAEHHVGSESTPHNLLFCAKALWTLDVLGGVKIC